MSNEPWKNPETLRTLYDGRTQGEIADYFQENGHSVTGATISYWMKKLEIDTTHTKHENTRPEPSDQRCENFETCGNMTPGARNTMCIECLDAARARDRNQ